MTFDDDFIRVHFQNGTRDMTLQSLALEWPPPALIEIGTFPFKLKVLSDITDEERSTMTHVCRGAEYFPDAQENLN